MQSVNSNTQSYENSADAIKVGVQGVCSEEVRSIFSKLEADIDRKIVFVEGSFESAATMLRERKIDISAHGISSTNHAAPSEISSPSEPYLSVKRGFNVIKGSKWHKADSIKGDSIEVLVLP